ncbi:MAG: DoxX family protein [Bacteroidota bacterium]
MKPLIVLLSVFAISLVGTKLTNGNYEIALSGRIAMAVMLVFTAAGHFAFPKGMSMMLPDFIPYKLAIIYMTGIIEIAAAIGVLIPSLREITAYLLIVFFILILPANINAAIKQVNLQKATLDGHGLAYLWFRIPLQIFFIIWVYLSTIKN